MSMNLAWARRRNDVEERTNAGTKNSFCPSISWHLIENNKFRKEGKS
jgi:hypothetical protein